MTSSSPLGLLLDVDGPLSSTRTRTMRVPTLAPDLTALAQAGCPVVFNTGRSADFLAERIIPELVAQGLRANDPVWGVGEKGATWFSLEEREGEVVVGEVRTDPAVTPAPALIAAGREIADRHADVVFFDETKRSMISLEQHVDVPSEVFLARRPQIEQDAAALLRRFGAADEMSVYPTFISVDVEHVDGGKALGARRALELIAERMPVPHRWFTAGDSGQDYDMARQLHELGYDATHLDVRISGDDVAAPFRVIRERPTLEPGHAEDDITARHIRALRDELGA